MSGGSDEASQVAALVAQMETAFKDVRLGRGITLRDAHEEYLSEPESYRRRQAAGGWSKPWWDEDIERSDPGGSAMSFMGPEAFRYYLPAYMTQFLTKYLPEPEAVLYRNPFELLFDYLSPACWEERREPLVDAKGTKFELFSDEQNQAVAQFLWFIAHQERLGFSSDCLKGLRVYWQRFLTGQEQAEFIDRLKQQET